MLVSTKPSGFTFSTQLVHKLATTNFGRCFECQKCSNGCPVAPAMDYPPHAVIHLLKLGRIDDALHSQAIWLCVSCYACSERCPNDTSIPQIVDTLREEALRQKITPADKKVVAFHQSFLWTVKRLRRANELLAILVYKWRVRDLTSDISLGLKMLKRGQLSFSFWKGGKPKRPPTTSAEESR